MPYIKESHRKFLADHPKEITSSGELNYMITQAVNSYIEQNGPLNYAIINNVIGAMESAKLEFYRRVAAPYEDKKIQENGDVY